MESEILGMEHVDAIRGDEANVVILICVGLANWSIDTMYPFNAASPILGFVYFLCLMVMLSIDVVEKKSRRFMVITFTFFLAITGHNVYSNMSANPPIVLADFNEYLQAQTTENRRANGERNKWASVRWT